MLIPQTPKSVEFQQVLSVQYGDSCYSIGVAKASDIISVGCGKNFVTYNS